MGFGSSCFSGPVLACLIPTGLMTSPAWPVPAIQLVMPLQDVTSGDCSRSNDEQNGRPLTDVERQAITSCSYNSMEGFALGERLECEVHICTAGHTDICIPLLTNILSNLSFVLHLSTHRHQISVPSVLKRNVIALLHSSSFI